MCSHISMHGPVHHHPHPQVTPCSPTMTFSELVDRVGSMGPFQFLNMLLLGLPILGMANHNLLQIFTAATPAHHCRPPPNASSGPWLLPTGLHDQPEPCLRFVHPPNASLPNSTQGPTEPCLDGWVYDASSRGSIVIEVSLMPAGRGTRGCPPPCSANSRYEDSLGESIDTAGACNLGSRMQFTERA